MGSFARLSGGIAPAARRRFRALASIASLWRRYTGDGALHDCRQHFRPEAIGRFTVASLFISGGDFRNNATSAARR